MKYLFLSLAILLMVLSNAHAEPYLAVRTNQPCATCHVNVTGGGLRTQYGSIYAQTTLPAIPAKDPTDSITSLFDNRLLFGTDARFSFQYDDYDDRDDVSRFETDQVTLYLAATVNEYLKLYVDQQVAPGGSLNLESFVLFTWEDWTAKAGKFFLPYGWRLQDDEAFIRQTTGINFDNPDNGVEVGYQHGPWDWQLAITNGSAGAAETNDGKQGTFRGEYIGNFWRLGVSGSYNNTDFIDRSMYGVFSGIQTGKVSWLLEWDRIEDNQKHGDDVETDLAYLEADYEFLRGQNLKITLEGLKPDSSDKENIYRGSVVWEYFPITFTQLRAGYRKYHSDDNTATNNHKEMFVQLHLYF